MVYTDNKDNNENTARNKSKKLAVRIVNLYKHLSKEKKEYVLSKQLYLSETEYISINEDALELLKMLKATTKTLSQKLKTQKQAKKLKN